MTVDSETAARSLAWSAVESGTLAVISFGSLIVYSRLLTQSEFGLFSIVLAITDLLGILVTMLFHDPLVQRRVITNLHYDTAFTFTMISSAVMMVGCWLAGPMLQQVFQQPNAAAVFACMGLVFPALGLSATIVAQQRRDFAFKSLAVRSLAGRIAGGVAGIAAAFVGAGIWSLVLQQIVMALISSLVLWFTAPRRPRLAFAGPAFRDLIGFGGFSVGALFLSFSTKRLFTILAGLSLGVAAAGFLNLAFRVVDVLWAVSATAVSQVALPMLAGLQSDRTRMERAYKRAVEFACLALYPCFAGIAVTAAEIIDTVFGHRWASAAPCIVALACLVLVQTPRLFIAPVLTAMGRPRDVLVGVIAELVFMLAVIAGFGMADLGVAIMIWIASECVQVPVTTLILRRATGLGVMEQFSGVRTPLLAAMVMALGVVAVRAALPADVNPPVQLSLLIVVGGLAYAAAICLLDWRLAGRFLSFVQSAFQKAQA